MYEGTFLVAVATAYFLALNGLAGFVFLRLVRAEVGIRDLDRRTSTLEPLVEDIAELWSTLPAAEGLKGTLSQSGSDGENHG